MTNQKLKWRLASSSLRLLLNHSEGSTITKIDQFHRINWQDTWFFYNVKTDNIIGTLRSANDSILIRYRQSSHYAHAFAGLAKRLQSQDKNVVLLPSYHIGRWQRRIRRRVSESGPHYTRDRALASLIQIGKPLSDNLNPKPRTKTPTLHDELPTFTELGLSTLYAHESWLSGDFRIMYEVSTPSRGEIRILRVTNDAHYEGWDYLGADVIVSADERALDDFARITLIDTNGNDCRARHYRYDPPFSQGRLYNRINVQTLRTRGDTTTPVEWLFSDIAAAPEAGDDGSNTR